MNKRSYIQSPDTGQYIRIKGPTYEKLKKEGKITPSYFKKAKKISRTGIMEDIPVNKKHINDILAMKVYSAKPLEEEITMYKHFQPKKLEKAVKKIKSGKALDIKGLKTRGWDISMPTKGKERHALKNKCGDSCFLGPSGTESFPICPKGQCKIDCRGVYAAKQKAARHGYTHIKDAADSIIAVKCKKK